MDSFSWRDVRGHPDVPNGSYATTTFDQHSVGWCGCCYIVAVVQTVEDRGHIAQPLTARYRVDMQTVVDHFNTSVPSEDTPWNACHGGYPSHVVECLIRGVCPLVTTQHQSWKGHPSHTHQTPLSTAPFRVTGVQRIPTRDVMDELYRRGPVVLEISGHTLKSVDGQGVVTDHTPNIVNHAVSVVGWKQTAHAGPCWIVRNSWGQHRVPVAIPDDIMCVDESGNRCEVKWEYWVGDPHAPGFCYIPMSHPIFHMSDPWIVPIVASGVTPYPPNEPDP